MTKPAGVILRGLSAEDRREVASRGWRWAWVRRQRAILSNPAPSVDVVRPCGLGDGIEWLPPTEWRRLSKAAEGALRKGRVSFFVPASGAASRLFSGLWNLHQRSASSQRPVREFLSSPKFSRERLFFKRLQDLALVVPLRRHLSGKKLSLANLLDQERYEPILEALLGGGLDVGSMPKALIPFHWGRGGGSLTAFDEHVRESLSWADGRGGVRLHFSVPREFERRFEERGRKWREVAEKKGVRLRFHLSNQDPETDTLAWEEGRGWARRSDGALLFRPGGHGALLANLQKTGGDLVWIRNIDNVPVRAFQWEGRGWRKRMLGLLLETTTLAREHEAAIGGSPLSRRCIERAEDFVRSRLGPVSIHGSWTVRRRRMLRQLDRPWRVCGMIRASGEPGGGPFWVQTPEGPRRQILESVQLTPRQRRDGGTHFNPVDMVVSLRDRSGKLFDLSRFSDRDQLLRSSKHVDHRVIETWEWPGLWNGAMAGWNTLFVDIPADMFHPVKTVTDLLRKGHQP